MTYAVASCKIRLVFRASPRRPDAASRCVTYHTCTKCAPNQHAVGKANGLFFRCRHTYQGERNFHILYQLVAGAADAGVDLKVIGFILVSVDTASTAK